MQISRVQKLITFSPQLYQLIERNAKKIGLSFPEYIRMLAANDVKEVAANITLIDPKTEFEIGKSLEDIKNKKYTVVDSDEELDKHLQSL